MVDFPELPANHYPPVFLEDTDSKLSAKPDPNLRYAIFKTIAKGGKCLVQSCKDMHLNRFVCYKSLLPEFANDPIEQQRFVREARVTAMLQHPNTVPTYELNRNNKGHYYFTMKLVHGYTLRELLDYRDRYDLGQLLDVVIQVAHALEYAHSHGVLHRDIKPENILAGPCGEVLLLDWGLAKVWSQSGQKVEEPQSEKESTADQDLSITMGGKLQGTVSYMSPEQINRDPNIDALTDIYSLGAVLYEILTGQLASQGETMDAIIASTLNDIPIAPSEITASISPLLESVCLQCLQKNPEDRIHSASELIRLLQEYLHQEQDLKAFDPPQQ